MRYIQGESREQWIFLPASLDDYISRDNETRSIDLFSNTLNPEAFGWYVKALRKAIKSSILGFLTVVKILKFILFDFSGMYYFAIPCDMEPDI